MSELIARRRVRTVIMSWILLTIGALLGAFQVVMFNIPADIVPGGVSSLGIISNELTGVPVGLFILVANFPILYLGYRMLGGWQIVAATGWVVLIYSLAVDGFTLMDPEPISDDRLLNALFGGAVGGISTETSRSLNGHSRSIRALSPPQEKPAR